MQDRPSPRLGCVKYLNARPLVYGWDGPVLFDHPAALCGQLARGELDIALVSSFEFLRNPIYRIVHGISISSDGPVYSVFVAHSCDISEIEEIELDPASRSSVNLLRCLLAESNLAPRLVARSTSSRRRVCAQLLIGDQAIHFRQKHGDEFRYWDLGEEWKRLLDLPFVYALWLVRPELSDPTILGGRLRALRNKNLADLDALIEQEHKFNPEFCARYYRENLQFNFGKREKEGLRAFQRLAGKNALLPTEEIPYNLV